MPNWCNNTVTIDGDQEQIDAFENFLKEKEGKNWFDFFRPMPESEKDNWYEWSVNHWGCKWNCDTYDWLRVENSISFSFDSPWGPPIALYEFMTNEGFEVEAHYLEEGMCFVGRFVDGFDECYDFDLSDEDSLDSIPEEIVEQWSLRELQQDFLAENSEDEEND